MFLECKRNMPSLTSRNWLAQARANSLWAQPYQPQPASADQGPAGALTNSLLLRLRCHSSYNPALLFGGIGQYSHPNLLITTAFRFLYYGSGRYIEFADCSLHISIHVSRHSVPYGPTVQKFEVLYEVTFTGSMRCGTAFGWSSLQILLCKVNLKSLP